MRSPIKYFLIALLMLPAIGCQNNNKLNLNTLKINVILNTPISFENCGWLNILFHSFQVGNVNYVSKNNNNKLGINLMRGDLPNKVYPINLPLHDGNGLKFSMDVYDNANLSDDLENFNLLSTFDEYKLSAYVTSNFTSKLAPETKKNTIYIDLNNPKNEEALKKEIAALITKNKNQCTINVVVNKSNVKEIPQKQPSDQNSPRDKIKEEPIGIQNVPQEVSSKVNAEFKTPLGLKLKYDLNALSWHNFGDITYKIEFIDYVSGKVCCKIDEYNGTRITAKYLLNEVKCITFTNRYIIKISTNARLKGYAEKVTCCSIGFQSGGFSEDCSCDNTCE